MGIKSTTLGLTLLASLLAAGCFPQEDSCNIKTDGIYFEYAVEEEGSNAVGKATLWVGDSPGGTNLVLGECGDELDFNGQAMSEKGGNPVYYEATVSASDTYDFVFTREDENPYSSTVSEMRPEVTVLGPSGDSFPRDQEFDVTWEDNDGGEILLLISGDCIWDYPSTLGDEVADNGAHTVPAGGIEPVDDSDNESCTAEIELSREVDGTLDSSLKGTIVGRSVGRSSFTTAPPTQ